MANEPIQTQERVTKDLKDLSVMIGRFSPPHLGHKAVIERAIKSSKAVLILIGSAGQARTTKNPFTYEERMEMIQDSIEDIQSEIYPGGPRVWYAPLYDHPYNQNAWIEQVQDHVLEKKTWLANAFDKDSSETSVYLTGCHRDETTWYLNSFGDFFKMDLIPKVDAKSLSATELRQLLFEKRARPGLDQVTQSTRDHLLNFMYHDEGGTFNGLLKEYEFIKSYKKAWSVAPFPPTFSTVDTCVIQSGHVLVNVRDNFPGKGLWALPGGFLEQHETLQDGAIRELKEETSIGLSDAQLYGSIKAKEIFDNPGRSLRGRTITTCFLLKLDDSKPLPRLKAQRGEVKKCEWIPISEALRQSERFFEDHHAILEWALGVKT